MDPGEFRKRTKQCLKGKYIYHKWREKGLAVYHRRDYERETIFRAISDYREAHEREDIRFLKTDESRTILTLPLRGERDGLPAGGAGEHICIKHFRYRGLLRALKDLLRTPRGRRSWVSGNALFIRGIPNCRPLALVEERRWGLLKESFLLMEDLSGLSNMHHYISNNFNPAARGAGEAALKRRFIAALGDSLLRLHQMGIYHGDLKSSNILVEETGQDWRFHYIDLDGVKFVKKVSLRRRAKNLAQIETSTPDCITLADRMRFFNHYLRGLNGIADRKAFLRRVVSQARKRTHIW